LQIEFPVILGEYFNDEIGNSFAPLLLENVTVGVQDDEDVGLPDALCVEYDVNRGVEKNAQRILLQVGSKHEFQISRDRLVIEIGSWSHVKFTVDELISQTVIGEIVVIFPCERWSLGSFTHAVDNLRRETNGVKER
jgi:hypothetical protein